LFFNKFILTNDLKRVCKLRSNGYAGIFESTTMLVGFEVGG